MRITRRLTRLTRAQHRLARARHHLARVKARGGRGVERCRRRHLRALKHYGDAIARWQRRHPA